MRKRTPVRAASACTALLAGALVGGPGLVHEFIVGPGTVGSPADDPSVGYTSVQLDQKLDSPDYFHTEKEYLALLERSRAAEQARAASAVPSAPAFAPSTSR